MKKNKARTFSEQIIYFWSRVRIRTNPDACWEWTAGGNSQGYGQITWCDRKWLVHRFAWWLAYGREPSDCLLHTCDNPRCVNVRHLFVGTRAENMADKVAKGRQLRGETCPVSRLSEADVVTARTLVGQGLTQTAVAALFNVDQSTISYAVRGITWGHI